MVWSLGGQLGCDVPPGAASNLGLAVFADGGVVQQPEPILQSKTTSMEAEQGEKSGEESEKMFILSEALPVIPAKLVRRILRAEYVDMAELLKDNIEAERRRAQLANGGTPIQVAGRQTRREVPDVLSWAQCFGMYTAVVGSRFPEKVKELLAYQTTIISEARRCGGRGWLLYDAAFRQQVRSFESVDFSRVNQSLYATTFLAYGGRAAKFCPDCMMADHGREECALQLNRDPPASRETAAWRGRNMEFRKRRDTRGACYAWNDSKCTFARCRYDHCCSKCGGDHRRAQCREAPGEKRREE